ncbi:hypothetical protein P4O66_009342, partial [Electrophorus voltai]
MQLGAAGVWHRPGEQKKALVDSGAAGNIVDWDFGKRLGKRAIALPSLLSVQALDGGSVHPGYITHILPCVLLMTNGEHTEHITFYFLSSLSHPIMLGLPWLRAHNPLVTWPDNHILQWAPACYKRCLSNKLMSLLATSIESPEADKQVIVPQEYEDPMKATLLPPHWEGDCAITIQGGHGAPQVQDLSPLPRGRVSDGAVHLRGTGAKAHINEILRDYLGRSVLAYIDDILIYSSSWNQHVLDVWAVLQTLLRNHLYCKAEKCEFHCREVDFLGYVIQEDSVRVEPGKMEEVRGWPTPHMRKALEWFLVYANLSRRFMKNFSSIAKPLTNQLWGPTKQVRWTPEVERSFEELKATFTTALVLQQSNPSWWRWMLQTQEWVPCCPNIWISYFPSLPDLDAVPFRYRPLLEAEKRGAGRSRFIAGNLCVGSMTLDYPNDYDFGFAPNKSRSSLHMHPPPYRSPLQNEQRNKERDSG